MRGRKTIPHTPNCWIPGINLLCVTRREPDMPEVPFPPRCETYRGGGFDNTLKSFWTVGKQYRVPGFLATSFDEKVADKFIGPSSPLDTTSTPHCILALSAPDIYATGTATICYSLIALCFVRQAGPRSPPLSSASRSRAHS